MAEKFNIVFESWDKYLNNIHSFSVKVKTKNKLINSQYTALVIKDGIVDYFKKKYRKRPNVDRQNPDIPIYVYIADEEIKIYIDIHFYLIYYDHRNKIKY